jgi:enoyl-CoA hydratase
MPEEIRTELAQHVAVITLNAPQRRNALTLELSARLAETVGECEADPEVNAVIVTGTDPAFCAGADLSALQSSRDDGPEAVYAGFLAVARCTLPTIAAVNGPAIGAGLNLALAADVCLAGATARFDPRFLQLGLHPGGGMTWMAQRMLPAQAAAAVTLFGRVLSADEALRVGLVHSVVPTAELLEHARAFAATTGEAPREVVLATKATMRRTAELEDHADAVDAELAPQLDSLRSEEFARRLRAMLEKVSSKNK